jgi:hypothetical protein
MLTLLCPESRMADIERERRRGRKNDESMRLRVHVYIERFLSISHMCN